MDFFVICKVNFGEKVITDLAIPLPGLASNLASNAIKISLKRK